MNKVFRVIWNHATQTWTAVSELASSKGKTKSSKLKKLSAAAVAVSSVVAIGQAQAAVEMSASTATFIAVPDKEVANANPKNTTFGVIIGSSAALNGNGVNQSSLIAIGNNAKAGKDGVKSTGAIAIGQDAESSGDNAIALAKSAKANGLQVTALGSYAEAAGTGATAVGTVAKANERATAVGIRANATGVSSVAVGDYTQSGERATAVGVNATASAKSSIAFGDQANASAVNTIAIGPTANGSTAGAVVIGLGANSQIDPLISARNTKHNAAFVTQDQVAVGSNATVIGDQATALGALTHAEGTQSVAVGHNANVTGYKGIAIGASSTVNKLKDTTYTFSGKVEKEPGERFNNKTVSIAESVLSDAGDEYNGSAIAIGPHSEVSDQSAASVVIGNQAKTNGNSHYSVVIGPNSQSFASDNIVMGHGSQSSARESVVLGTQAVVSGADSIRSVAIGFGATVTKGDPAIDPLSDRGSYDATAVGTGAQVTVTTGAAFGANSWANRGSASVKAFAFDASELGGLHDRRYQGNTTGYEDGSYGATERSLEGLWSYGANYGELSLGRDGVKRQITNLAGGSDDYDAVNVAQLKNVGVVVKGNKPAATKENPNPEQTKTDFLVHSGALHIVGEEGGRITTEARHRVIKKGENGEPDVIDPNDSEVVLKFDATGFVKENLSTVNNDGKKFITNLGSIVEAADESITVTSTKNDTTGQVTYKVKSNAKGGGWNANATGNVEGTSTAKAVPSDGNVNLDAGKNLTVTQTTDADGKNQTYSFALSDEVTVGAKDGAPGKDGSPGAPGKDGSIGVNGKDGSAVAINGKDGSIGLKGKDGANGLTIRGEKGAVGVDGTDGADGKDGMTRIVYEDGKGTKHEVATTKDGLKFAGDDGADKTKVIEKKLNEKLEIVGGAKGELTENNIGVNNKDGKLNVQLAKNIDLTNAGSVTTGNTKVDNTGVTIKAPQGGTTTDVTLTAAGLNNGGNVIKNVAEGKADTDAVNVSQLNKLGNNTIQLGGDASTVTATQTLNKTGGIKFDVVSGDAAVLKTVASNAQVAIDLTDDAKAKLNHVVKVEGKGGNVHVNPNTTKTGETVYEITVDAAQAVDPTKLADGTNTNVTGDGSATNPYKVNLNTTVDLTDAGSLKAGDTTVNNNGLTITGGPNVTKAGIDAGSKVINNVADGKVSADSKEAVNGSQLHAVKAAERHIKPDTYSVDNDGTVTMTYVDGEGNDVTGEAKITGIAKNDLSNITEGGKNVIQTEAKKAINVKGGKNADVKKTDEAGVDTYTVNVEGALTDITSITNNAGSGKVSFNPNGVVTVGEGKTAINFNGNTGDITGLTNVNLDAADFGKAGRAATEEQLKIVNTKVDTKIDDNDIRLAGNTGKTDNQKLSKEGGIEFSVISNDTSVLTTAASASQVAIDLTQDAKDKLNHVVEVKAKDGSTNVHVNKNTDTKGKTIYEISVDETEVEATALVNGKNTTVEGNGSTSNPYKVNVSDNLVLGGKDGADGKDGVDGSIGVNGKDGSAVAINGKDGSIGLNGTNGANGVTIKGDQGPAGVNGKDGETKTRLIVNNEKVATLEDGLKFAGDDGADETKVIAKKLNEKLEIVGGADKDELTENNIGVNNKDGKLNVQLAKNINLTDKGSIKFGDNLTINNGGLTIKDGPSITDKGINAGNKAITNVKAGEADTDAVNVAQLKEVKAAERHIKPTKDGAEYTVNNDGDVTLTYVDGNGKDVADTKAVIKGIAKSDLTNITDAGKKVITGLGTIVKKGDNVTVDEVVDETTGQRTYTINALAQDLGNTELKYKANGANEQSVKVSEGLNFTNGDYTTASVDAKGVVKYDVNLGDKPTVTDGKAGVPGKDGNPGKDGIATIGSVVELVNNIGWNANAGGNLAEGTSATSTTVKAGNTVNFNAGKNLTVEQTIAANGDQTYTYALSNDITIGDDKNPGTITVKGENGKDGVSINGKDGTIGLKGEDGKDGIALNGKDGTIGINGKDGANGSITVKAGKPGVDGKDGETKTRLIVNNEEVSTLNDGLKFKGDDETVIAKKLNEQLDIVGGAKGELTENNIGVNSKDGKLKVQLAKNINLTDSGSIKFGDNLTINNGGLTIKDGPSITNTGINAGNKVITNVKAGEADTDAVNVKQLKDGERYVTNKTYQVEGKDGNVTLTYTDGSGKVIEGMTATITGVAKNDLSNITDGGKKVVQDLINMENGTNTVASSRDVNGVKTFKVDVKGDLADITSVTGAAGTGKVEFAADQVVNVAGDKTIKLDAKTGDITGLTNVNLDATDFGKAGRAATEEQLRIVRDGAAANRTTVESSDGSISVVDTSKDKNKHTYDIKVNNQGVVNNAQVPVVYTKADGTKVYLQADGTFNTAKDGKGEEVKAGDVIVSINNPANSTTDGNTIFNNIGSAIKNQAGDTYLAKLDEANKTTPNAAVNVTDLKQTADALAAKGLKFKGQDGKTIHKNLGETLEIVGKGEKAITEYDASNIKTYEENGKVVVALAKDLAVNKVTVGKDGKDGKDGVDGTIGVNGKDGASVVLNGKDGSIGLTGAKGADGKDGASTNLTVATGNTTVSERDGGKGITRVTYTDKDKDGKEITREVATLDDGLKFTGDDGKTVNRTLGSNLNITGGAKDATTADNIRITNDGNNGLKVQLANNITLDKNGSLNIGGTTIKDGNITVGNTTLNGDTIKVGDTTINNGSVTNLTHHINAPVNNVVDANAVTLTEAKKKEAATVGDVLNAGWNLQAKGKAVDAVTHGDTVNFESDDTITITPTSDGKVNTLNFTVNANAVVKQVTGNVAANTTTAKAEVKKAGIATVDDVANTINNTGWKTTTTDGKSITVNPGDTVNYVNGKGTTANVTTTNVNGADVVNVTYDVKADGNTITITDKGLTVNTGDITPAGNNGKVEAKAGDELKVATVKNVADAINSAGWVVNTGKAADQTAFTTVEGSATKVGAGTQVNFQAGNNIEVKREGNNIIYATSEDINATTVTVTGKPGKDGQPGKDAALVVGQNGKDGKDGVDGTIGVNGKDGSAVVINGKDGSIGLNGKDGANGVSIKGQAGKVGVDGKDGETRLVYVEKDNPGKTHEIATTDDGLKFTGNNEVVNNHKLNSKVTIKGEGVTKSQSENFKSAKGNINVKADGQGTLEVQLAKDVDLGDDGSVKAGNTTVNNNGVTIKNSDPNKQSVSITENGLNNGGNRIENVAPGVKGTDAVNVNQLRGETANIRNDMNKLDKNLRAGIAGAMATGGLYHATLPGKSMVSAGVGSYKGEGAAAVGYSRLSDNGKVGVKFSVNTNTRGDAGAAASVGYQW